MKFEFRRATSPDLDPIWDILKAAILRRKNDGSSQWQDGYPNREVILSDIAREAGFVLAHEGKIIGYCALFVNDEPEYLNIKGKWITNGDFIVVHRIAIDSTYIGKGLAKEILTNVEGYALSINVFSIKVDTNFDNIAMIKSFEKLGYEYCGEVMFRGSSRKAYEKVLLLES